MMANFRAQTVSFWFLMGTVLLVAVWPAHETPSVFASDALNRMLAFFVLALFARLLWPRTSATLIFFSLALFGGFIEILQAWAGFGHQAEWRDFALSLVDIVAGIGAWKSIKSVCDLLVKASWKVVNHTLP
jgi:hypothetical protein